MGADTFFTQERGNSAREAFIEAVQKARHEYGHAGYTGSIAEKNQFVTISLPQGRDAFEFANELIENADPRIDNKWGPAGCIPLDVPPGETVKEYLFFGWASC